MYIRQWANIRYNYVGYMHTCRNAYIIIMYILYQVATCCDVEVHVLCSCGYRKVGKFGKSNLFEHLARESLAK